MTRDFLIEFDNKEELKCAERLLSDLTSADGVNIFGSVDNRGDDIYVTLTYPYDIDDHFKLYLNGEEYIGKFRNDVTFVAIKNGHHHTQGYYLDSSKSVDNSNYLCEKDIPLKDVFSDVINHFR
jgi:hypothetical protein